MSSIFEPFQAAATAAAREVWPALSPTLRGLLEDAAGGSAKGQDALGTHLLESIAAEQALASAGIQPPALEGPGALARARFGAQREVQAALADAPPLDTEQHASELAEELFAETFSIRAQKRRGGVYTRRALVDTLLDLSGWG
ncbi:MAG: hypothetical protein JKY65_07080, partial [Planctomycetes bacterium]|nr:hypothetical protein [Planctomycetota bacterium]